MAQLTNMVSRIETLSTWNMLLIGTAIVPGLIWDGAASSICSATSRAASRRGGGSAALHSATGARQIRVFAGTLLEASTGILNCAPIAKVSLTASAGAQM